MQELHVEIGRILGLDKRTDAILIGAGNLGRAVVNHMDFDNHGFKLVGIFDKNPERIGQKIKDVTIMETDNSETIYAKHKPIFAVLCIPKTATPSISERLIKLELGIKGF